MTQLMTTNQQNPTTTTSTTASTTPERASTRQTITPAVDIFETKTDVVLVADLPGVSVSGLHVEAKDDQIAVRGARADADVDYVRAFRLPPGVDVDGITADLKDGVLTLTLPKPAAMKPRVITVH